MVLARKFFFESENFHRFRCFPPRRSQPGELIALTACNAMPSLGKSDTGPYYLLEFRSRSKHRKQRVVCPCGVFPPHSHTATIRAAFELSCVRILTDSAFHFRAHTGKCNGRKSGAVFSTAGQHRWDGFPKSWRRDDQREKGSHSRWVFLTFFIRLSVHTMFPTHTHTRRHFPQLNVCTVHRNEFWFSGCCLSFSELYFLHRCHFPFASNLTKSHFLIFFHVGPVRRFHKELPFWNF